MKDGMEEFALVRFSKKAGKIDTTLSGISSALLCLWGLQNTTKTKATIVFSQDTGKVLAIYTGDESGFPKVQNAQWDHKDLGVVDDYCDGLLEAVRQSEFK